MANKKLLIGLLAVMLVLGGCPESEEGVKDDGKDAPKTVKYESTDTAGKTYIFIITVSGSGVAEGDTYVLTIKEAGQPDKVIQGTVSGKGTDGALTLKQNGSEEPLSVTVNNGQMTAINGPIAVEGGEPITAPGPLTPIVNNNNNNNNGGGEEINTGGNWLERKVINYKVSNGVASVSGEANYNWIIYRGTPIMAINTDYEQKYTTSGYSISDSGTITNSNASYHYTVRLIGGTGEITQTITSTMTDSSGAMISQNSSTSSQQYQNGYPSSVTVTSEQTQSNGQFLKQTQTQTYELDAVLRLPLRYTLSVTYNTNIPNSPYQNRSVTVNYTINLLSDTDGIKTYKYYRTDRDEYEVYKYQNGRQVERSSYRNGVLESTVKTTYDNSGNTVMKEESYYNDGVLGGTEKTTYDNGIEVLKEYYNSNGELGTKTTYTRDNDKTITLVYGYNYNGSESLKSSKTETKVTIKEGLTLTTNSSYGWTLDSDNYSETVTVLSDNGSEVVVRYQKVNRSNVLTEQKDTTYRK